MAPGDAKQRVVVIVDPYSSGRYLVQELQQQQWAMVGVQSSQDLAGFWLAQFDPSLFVRTINHDTLDATLDALHDLEIVAVLAGSEPGVLLAEELQTRLGLPGNGAETKEWRRDKYAMSERLREVGVRAVHQLYSCDVEEILRWQQQWGRWPVIVKPAMSGGTDGVYWCHSAEDVRHAHLAESGKLNVNGVVNDKLLVQEYLDGLEYIVDCVSSDGRHVVSGIWVYKKTKDPATRAITYEYARLLESTGEVQDRLVKYVFDVLDALNLRHGPSHTEIIMTEDGPCLVETGARMHGVKGPKLLELGTGIGTHELVIDVAVNGARVFNDLHAKSWRYTVKKWVFETFFRNESVQGTLTKAIDAPEIRALASVMDIFPSIKPGEELKITRDLATAPGVILQLHPSVDVCLADIERIRALEASSLYEVKVEQSIGSPKFVSTSPYVMSPSRKQSNSFLLQEDEEADMAMAMEGLDLDEPADVP